MIKPLTKSRFKMALECPTRLYYEARPGDYRNQMTGDEFLAALADGGHQVGALAKFKYHPDPVGAGITIEAAGYDEPVAETQRRLAAPGRVVIAEAALRHENFFVRVDILVRDPQQRRIEIIEVKSKSADAKDVADRFKHASWKPYLYDVAFQAEVAARVFPGWQIVPKLLVLNKDVACDIDGLHQLFPVIVEKGGRSVRIDFPPGLRREDLGSLDLLLEADVSDIVADLHASPVPSPHAPSVHAQDLPSFMAWCAQLQVSGERHFGGVSKSCKSCPYRAAVSDPLRSGVHECMEAAIQEGLLKGPAGPLQRAIPLAIDLWGGFAGTPSMADRVLEARRSLLADIQEADILPKNQKPSAGFSALERRMAQVRAARDPLECVKLHEERLSQMDQWHWPLHMIDFETSAPALPFFKGNRPYETLAFQFSHHVMDKDAEGRVRIRHASQWISTDAGAFPSLEFVRQLRRALMPDGELRGTVFRYHNHENTVLHKLRPLVRDSGAPDADDLSEFIDRVTRVDDDSLSEQAGSHAMVDLYELVREGYYSAHAGGSISLKYMLPAILNDAPQLRELYASAGLYGQGLRIPSLNFEGGDGQVWLRPEAGWNPYQTLPPIFGPDYGEIDTLLTRLADDEDAAINHGGSAMTAFSYTQFDRLDPAHRERIRQALLRYCELDTLAMVMLVQGLMELRGRALTLAP